MTYTNWKCFHDPQIIKDYNIKETPENHIKLFDASHQCELENINYINPFMQNLNKDNFYNPIELEECFTIL